MSHATEAQPVSPPPAATPIAPASEGEPYRHPFAVDDDDWKNTPSKVQGTFVELLTELDRVYEVVRFLLGDKYGPRSEKSKKHEQQKAGEPEPPEDAVAPDDKSEQGGGKAERASDSEAAPEPEPDLTPPPPPVAVPGRKKLPAFLPRRQVILDVPGAQKLCSCCGEERPSFFSEADTSEQYGYIPAQFFVWQYKRRKYGACPCGGRARQAEEPTASGASDASTTPSPREPVTATSNPEVPGAKATKDEQPTPDDGTSYESHAPSPAESAIDSTRSADLTTSSVEPSAPEESGVTATGDEQPAREVGTPQESQTPPPSESAIDPTIAAELQASSADIGPAIQSALLRADIMESTEKRTLATITKLPSAPVIILSPPLESTGECQPTVLVAPPLPQMVRKGLPSHGLLVDIIVKKVQDGLPLYRQAAQFLRGGVDIKRSTMTGWLIKVGRLLAPIMLALRLEVLLARCVHIDETPFDVLAELKKKASAQAYMWVFAGGPAGRPAVEFRYDSSRSAEVPRSYMQGYTGDVLTDGYAGYDFLEKWVGVTLLACWVHVRRKFHDVIKALPAKFRGKNTIANQALERIRVLYRLEKYADRHHFTEEQRRELRQQRAKPIIDSMKTWLEEVKTTVPHKTKLGEAIAYALNQWSRLEHYVNTGYRPLDNNLVENLIRPFALGRKAWLFCATPDGAKAMATFHSLVATAIVNGVDPGQYLRALFDQFAVLLERSHPIHGPTPDQCRSLLPQYIDRDLLEAHLPEHDFLLAALTTANDLTEAA